MKKIITLMMIAVLSVSCFMLTACVPANLEKAERKMKEDGYAVTAYAGEYESSDGFIGGIDAVDGADTLTALLFDSKDNAKKFYNGLADKSRAFQKGKWVFWGTEDAVDDFD